MSSTGKEKQKPKDKREIKVTSFFIALTTFLWRLKLKESANNPAH